MKVKWTLRASKDIDLIYDYISMDSVFYAKRMIDRITARTRDIELFPFSGRIVPEFGTENIRELIEKPYRIIYRVREKRIDILSVVHSMRELE